VDTLRGLSSGQIEQVRAATEDILEDTGFRVEDAEILDRARAEGAKVDGTGARVRIPAPLLRELLDRVPPAYTIASLDGVETRIGGGAQQGTAIVTDPWIIDYATQRPRRPCLDDIRRHTIIAQKLDDVAQVTRMDFPVTDYEDATSSLRALEQHLLHHAKHNLVVPASLESYRQWLDIGKILARGNTLAGSNLFTVAVAIVSPLALVGFNARVLLSACEHGFPVLPTICPMAGTTSPYSIASTLLLANCEAVFLAALTQILNPGQPYLYASGHSVTDMQTGHDLYYTLDKFLWKLAAVQLAQSYNMPCMAECGGTLTHRYDQQSGAEGMLFMLAAHASGADMLSGFGSCHDANGMSAEMMLIHTAWLDATRFLTRGVTVDPIHLAVENIKNAGPGGHFLTDELTMRLLRGDEFFRNDLFDLSGGYHDAPSLLERAHAKVDDMLADFQSPVPGPVQEDLRRYFHDLYTQPA